MPGRPFGTVVIEMDLDATRYMKGQKTLLAEAQNASKTLERNFQVLGIKSDATFDLMRSRASLAYKAIVNDARSSFSDRLRAQEAYSIAAKRIDMEQFNQERELHRQRASMSRDTQAGWLSMMKGMLAYRVILSSIMAVQNAFTGTFRYLATIETAQLGIAASFMTAGQYIDSVTGKALQGAQALKAAQVDSKDVIEDLKAANLATIATLDELIVAYQQTLPVAMAKGFDKKQVKDFTVAMVQAAGAIGVAMNQMGEETRSILTGSINPRTSRIATVLGLRNEDIRQFKDDANGLFNFLMDKLKAYQVAGVEAQTTWAGLWSNMKDIMFQYLGEGMSPLFDALKREMTELTKSMIVIDEKTKKISWNPEFLKGIETFKSAVTTIIADMRRLVMLVDLIGMGLAMAANVATLGLSKTVKDTVKLFEERFKKNEAALMDMAMAQQGYTRATKETVGAIEQETFYGREILYYTKETTKESGHLLNKTKELTEEAKKLAERWKEKERNLNAKIAGEGLGELQKKIIDIRREAEALTAEFGSVAGAAKKIAQWKTSAEQDAIKEAQRKVREAVEALREKMQKDEMAALEFTRKEEKRLFEDREKALKDYQKIVTESNDWSVSEHQRAINKILSDESTNVAKMYELWEAGYINLAQLDAGLAAVRGAAFIATEAQIIKQLADELSVYEDLAGFEEVWYEKKLAFLDAEIERLRIKHNLEKEVVDAMKAQGAIKIGEDLWDKQHKNQKDMLESTYKMIDATAEMFEKEGKQIKAIQMLKQAAHVAEMGMNMAKAISTFALAKAKAAEAVAAQATVPVAGFAMASAMLAFMASVLGMGGIAFGGATGGMGGVNPSASARYSDLVLGAEADEQADTMRNIQDILEETFQLEYWELSGIHNAVQDLNQNIIGLVTGAFKTGGFNAERFGMASPLSQFFFKGAGLTFGSASIGQLLSGMQMQVTEYVNAFGETVTSMTDVVLRRALSDVFKSMGETIVELSKTFGVSVNQTLNYVFTGAALDLTGKSADEVTEAVNTYFAKMGSDAVRAVFGTMFDQYQKLGETLLDTAIRVAVDMATVMDVLEMTGKSFYGTKVQMIAFSEALIKVAGDLDELRESAATYYDAFFTDAEKQARLQSQLSGALAGMGMVLPTAREGYRDLVEGLDLTTTAGKEAFVTLLKLSDAADEYYDALEKVGGSQEQLARALEDQVRMITDWIFAMNQSNLAPVMSMEGWQREYERQRALAGTPGATTQDVSAFLNYAKEYLQFMRTYGGDYQAVYASVMGDVQELGEMKNTALSQLDAIKAADMAARLAASRQLAATYEVMGMAAPAFAGGGLTSGPSLAGERGQEWIVPTYEPERSRFLESVPPQFWENLRGASAPQGGGSVTIPVNLYLDGKVVAKTVAYHVPRDAELNRAIATVRKVN